MAPLQISQRSSESCPIAKSPRGSPNPRQPLKRARMKLFSEQRELKRAKSQSHRLPARHWLKAKEQPACSGRQPCSRWTDSRPGMGGGERAGRSHTSDPGAFSHRPETAPQGDRAARSLPVAFPTHRPSGPELPTRAPTVQVRIQANTAFPLW